VKLKARDIIPGWPKGRSTSTFILNRDDLVWCLWLNRANYHKSFFEMKASVEYHEAQQRMMNGYFERWRTPRIRLDNDRIRLRHLIATGQYGMASEIPDTD